MKLKLKQLLIDLEEPNTVFSIFGKNNLCICEATAECHLKTSKRLLNKEVFYWGVSHYENEIVVVINKKVRIYK